MGGSMLDGFWILQIQKPGLTSGGVVVFINGKVFGGDNGFAWVGTYQASEQLIKGRVAVHNFDPSIPSILGIPGDYDLHFTGNVKDTVITGTAILANRAQDSLAIRLTKRANL
jgi:T3SS negative regulator,GrlR